VPLNEENFTGMCSVLIFMHHCMLSEQKRKCVFPFRLDNLPSIVAAGDIAGHLI
jgi:hypothetical protein